MRLASRIGAQVRAALGAALAPAPDPRVGDSGSLERERELLVAVRAATAELAAAENRLASKVELLPEREAAALKEQLADVKTQRGALSMLEGKLAAELATLIARRDLILARYTAAEAQVRIKEALAGISGDFDALGALLRTADERTRALESRAAAIERLFET